MKARQLFERAYAGPTEAPTKPDVKPDTKPTERPGAPQRPPEKHPNPFRRRDPSKDPGPLEKPKARSKAKELLRTEAYNALTSDPPHWKNPRSLDCPSCKRKGGEWCKNTSTGKSMPNKTHKARISANRKLRESQAKQLIRRLA